jgi:hypothetical protein
MMVSAEGHVIVLGASHSLDSGHVTNMMVTAGKQIEKYATNEGSKGVDKIKMIIRKLWKQD